MKDFYKILGVDEKSTHNEIKTAYKELAKKYHPDKNPNNKQAEDKFKEISEAYETLGDDNKRRQYDASKRMVNGFNHSDIKFTWSNSPFSDFDNDSFIFGMGSRIPLDIMIRINITFDEMISGVEKDIFYNINNIETGTTEKKNVKLNIQKGIETGTKILYRGLGNKAKGSTGNLIAVINVLPHNIFNRNGCNVYYEYPVTLTDALIGGDVSVPTPKDGNIKIKIPVGATTGQRIRIPNRGLPIFDSNGLYGDVEIFIVVETPSNITDDQKKKVDEFIKIFNKENYPTNEKFKEIAGVKDNE